MEGPTQRKIFKTIHNFLSKNCTKKHQHTTSLGLYSLKSKKLHENRKHEKDKMNDPIIDKEVQEAIKLLKACVCYFLTNVYFSPNDSPSKTIKQVFYFI